jgi:hypothetical protein
LSKIETIRNALRELLAQHRQEDTLPTSARFLYYELVTLRVISKEKTGKRRPDQDMIDALTDLRESGEIPWNWITDETRSLEDYAGYATITDGVLSGLAYIELDPWGGDVPLILCESRSLAGCLRSVTSEYGVRIASTNGQCGGFLHTRIVPILQPEQRVLYLGDLDLCGNDIEDNTRRVLEQELGALLDWERLALTEAQVERYQLPKIIKGDKRFSGDKGVHEAVETEALSQRIIVDILRERLEHLLPEPLESVHERAEQERIIMRRQIEARGARQ